MPDQPMNLTPGCTVCEHNAETLGVDMPKADAADALAAQLAILNTDRARRAVAEVSLAFIRDAIHRDGEDANAIRAALGLKVQRRHLCTCGGDWGGFSHTMSDQHEPLGPSLRVVGEWQEVQP